MKLLDSQDARVINVALDALENILKAGDATMTLESTENEMARLIEEAEGIELIQNLQFHQEEGWLVLLTTLADVVSNCLVMMVLRRDLRKVPAADPGLL